MHLILYLPHRLRKQTPFMPHLRKSTHKGTQLCRNSELLHIENACNLSTDIYDMKIFFSS